MTVTRRPGQHRADKSGLLPAGAEQAVLDAELDEIITPEEGLGSRTARGAFVTLSGQLMQVVLQLASVVILARLLTPHDYGLYATVLVIVGVGEIFREFGLSSAAIQAAMLTRFQRDNLFWVNSGIGAALTGLTVLAAPGVAAVFHQHALVGITRVLAFTFLINGLATQFRAGLSRRLRFLRLALADLTGQAVGLTVAIVCAALGSGYWALVASQLAQTGTVLILVVVFSGWLPRLPRRGVPMAGFLRYGWNFAATQLVNYVGNNFDSTIIALRIGATPLGLYNRAFQLVMNPLNQFRSPATTVALPVLSRLQNDVARANTYLRRGQIAMGYTIIAGLAIAAGAAGPLVRLALGKQWNQVIPLFVLLAVAGSFQMLAYVGYWAYLSRGLTNELFRYTLVSFALRIVCIGVGSAWGIVGVAAGYAIAHGLEWPLSLWWLRRKTVTPVRELYLGATRITVMATLAGVASFAVTRALDGWPTVAVLALAGLAGLAVYALAAGLHKQIRADIADVLDVAARVVRR
jgi:O-antigen/teichoic acid export membrane protein